MTTTSESLHHLLRDQPGSPTRLICERPAPPSGRPCGLLFGVPVDAWIEHMLGPRCGELPPCPACEPDYPLERCGA